jgi:hypothetical protein
MADNVISLDDRRGALAIALALTLTLTLALALALTLAEGEGKAAPDAQRRKHPRASLRLGDIIHKPQRRTLPEIQVRFGSVRYGSEFE